MAVTEFWAPLGIPLRPCGTHNNSVTGHMASSRMFLNPPGHAGMSSSWLAAGLRTGTLGRPICKKAGGARPNSTGNRTWVPSHEHISDLSHQSCLSAPRHGGRPAPLHTTRPPRHHAPLRRAPPFPARAAQFTSKSPLRPAALLANVIFFFETHSVVPHQKKRGGRGGAPASAGNRPFFCQKRHVGP